MSDRSGVYALVFRRPAGKSDLVYVGSAGRTFAVRWAEHARALEQGTHVNPRMQAAYLKYGPPEHEVLQTTPPGEAAGQAEQLWLDIFYGEPNCLNLCSDVHNPSYCPDAVERMKQAQRDLVPDIRVTFTSGFSREFESQAEAARALGVDPAAISRALARGLPAVSHRRAPIFGMIERIERVTVGEGN